MNLPIKTFILSLLLVTLFGGCANDNSNPVFKTLSSLKFKINSKN